MPIAIKNCRRQAQVFVQKIPAEMNDVFARHRHGKVAESLVQMADLLFSLRLYAVFANDSSPRVRAALAPAPATIVYILNQPKC